MFLKKTMKNKKKQHKIRTRIMLLYLALSTALLCVLVPALYLGVRFSTKEGLDSNMKDTIEEIKNSLYIDSNNEIAVNKEMYSKDFSQGGVYVIVTDENNNVIFHTFSMEMMIKWLNDEKPDGWTSFSVENGNLSSEIFDYIKFDNVKNEYQIGKFDEELLIKVLDKSRTGWDFLEEKYDVSGREVCIVTIGNVYLNRLLDNIFNVIYVIIPVYLIFAAFGSRILAQSALKPIENITDTTREIKNGKLDQRIDMSNLNSEDEVGKLALTFNEMLEELEVSFKREKQFTSDASHELRTPVSVISACADEALQTDSPEIIRDNLEMIQSESGKMSKIISQLLMLSRGYEGRYHFEPEKIELKFMMDSVAEVSSFEADKRNIVINNEVKEGIFVTADQSLLTQVFMNLVGNAVKYGKDKGHVTVKAEENDDSVKIFVEDDGIGISEEDKKHIFERFYRADSARDRNGSGLGLSIVKWIVDIHKGSIDVSGEEGKGSIFTVTLPKNGAL